MNVANEILNDLIHIVIHDSYPLTPRSTEPLQHELYLVFDELV